ncbi:MOSC domain-containing protein [Variovorax atrisoli]|uniref:MOSC domain-containing protein n=1 Tax=Variovorax atrisoli TaxID=3394203 RepID=UPI00339A7C3E
MSLDLPPDVARPSTLGGPLHENSDRSWQKIGSVRGLRYRVAKEPAPRPASQVQAVENYGLVGDRHAHMHSPRQLLIASEDAYQRFDLPEAVLRENLLVDSPTRALCSGNLLRIGRDVVLWLTFHCEPCSLLDRHSPGILKTIGLHRGMLARVLRGGTMRNGDEISLARSSIPTMSNDWDARVLNVVRAVPTGQYITYRQLADLAGVATAYCRAFPRVLSRLPPEVASRARGAANSLPGPQWSGSELFDVRAHFG